MNIEEILARLWLIVATSSSLETKDYPNCIVMKQDLKNLLTAYEKEKEKNKKAIDFINDKNNYFEDGENWQNILKIKEILEE